jgi:hypothetical protein
MRAIKDKRDDECFTSSDEQPSSPKQITSRPQAEAAGQKRVQVKKKIFVQAPAQDSSKDEECNLVIARPVIRGLLRLEESSLL